MSVPIPLRVNFDASRVRGLAKKEGWSAGPTASGARGDLWRCDAQRIAPSAHAVLLADQAGWHMSAGLVVPPNATIIALPPKCPEVNPVENVCDNWLSNRVFNSYDDLVDHCCEAWNRLTDQPWRIMSIGLRQWAHGFSSRGTGIS
jgi:hypothetical protein